MLQCLTDTTMHCMDKRNWNHGKPAQAWCGRYVPFVLFGAFNQTMIYFELGPTIEALETSHVMSMWKNTSGTSCHCAFRRRFLGEEVASPVWSAIVRISPGWSKQGGFMWIRRFWSLILVHLNWMCYNHHIFPYFSLVKLPDPFGSFGSIWILVSFPFPDTLHHVISEKGTFHYSTCRHVTRSKILVEGDSTVRYFTPYKCFGSIQLGRGFKHCPQAGCQQNTDTATVEEALCQRFLAASWIHVFSDL